VIRHFFYFTNKYLLIISGVHQDLCAVVRKYLVM